MRRGSRPRPVPIINSRDSPFTPNRSQNMLFKKRQTLMKFVSRCVGRLMHNYSCFEQAAAMPEWPSRRLANEAMPELDPIWEVHAC